MVYEFTDIAGYRKEIGDEMTRIYTPFNTQNLDNDQWTMVTSVFEFESDVLKKYGYKSKNPIDPDRITIIVGFIQDGESVPIIRGRNKRGGLVHDWFSCFDSDPVVPKWIAALVYLEINAYCDSIDTERFSQMLHPLLPNSLIVPIVSSEDFMRRWCKFLVVVVWPRYFHKRSVFATCKELIGVDGDPYMKVAKLNAAIVQSTEATAAIKEVPEQVVEKPAMVAASEQVTSDLKDAKADVIEKAEVKQ